MTVHAHDPAVHADSARTGPTGGATATTAARPRWLVPGLAIGVIAATLVVAGVLFLTVLYALFDRRHVCDAPAVTVAMAVGGHGGHGGNGADEQAPAEERANQARADSERPMRGCH